jgi:hypothetical protein
VGIVLATELFQSLDSEPRLQEGVQEDVERKMRAVDTRTEPLGIGDAGSGTVIAPRRTVAAVQLGNAFGPEEQ